MAVPESAKALYEALRIQRLTRSQWMRHLFMAYRLPFGSDLSMRIVFQVVFVADKGQAQEHVRYLTMCDWLGAGSRRLRDVEADRRALYRQVKEAAVHRYGAQTVREWARHAYGTVCNLAAGPEAEILAEAGILLKSTRRCLSHVKAVTAPRGISTIRPAIFRELLPVLKTRSAWDTVNRLVYAMLYGTAMSSRPSFRALTPAKAHDLLMETGDVAHGLGRFLATCPDKDFIRAILREEMASETAPKSGASRKEGEKVPARYAVTDEELKLARMKYMMERLKQAREDGDAESLSELFENGG